MLYLGKLIVARNVLWGFALLDVHEKFGSGRDSFLLPVDGYPHCFLVPIFVVENNDFLIGISYSIECFGF